MTLESYPSFLPSIDSKKNRWSPETFASILINPVLEQSNSIFPWQWQYLCVDGQGLVLINIVEKICQVMKGIFLFWLDDWTSIRRVNSTLLKGLSELEGSFLKKEQIDELKKVIQDKPEHKIVLDYLKASSNKEKQEIRAYFHKDRRHWVMGMTALNSRADHFQYRHDLKYEYTECFLNPLLAQRKYEYLYWSEDGLALVGSLQAFVQWVKSWFGFTDLTSAATINSIVLKGLYEGTVNGFITQDEITSILKKMQDHRPVQLAEKVNDLVKQIQQSDYKEMQNSLITFQVEKKRDLLSSLWTRVWDSVWEFFIPIELPKLTTSDVHFGDTPLGMAKFANEKKDFKQAFHYFQLAQRVNSDPAFQKKLGDAFLKCNEKSNNVLSNKQIYLALAKTARNNNEYDNAEKYYEAGLKWFKDDEDLFFDLGELYLSKKEGFSNVKLEKCLPALIKSYEKSQNHETLENLASAFHGLKKYKEAVEYWKKIINIYEKLNSQDFNLKSADLYERIGDEYSKGNVGATNLGLTYDYASACGSYELALKKRVIDENLFDKYIQCVKHLKLSASETSKRFSALIEPGLKQAVQGDLWFKIGEAYIDGKIGLLGIFGTSIDHETAFIYFEKACEADESLRGKFQERFLKLSDEKNCIEHYEKAYKADLKKHGAHIQFLLKLYILNQDLTKAIALYKEILTKWPTEVNLLQLQPNEWYGLGSKLNLSKDKGNDSVLALGCLKKAIDCPHPLTAHLTSYYTFILDFTKRKITEKKSFEELKTVVGELKEGRTKPIAPTLLVDINIELKTLYVKEAESCIKKSLFDDSKEMMVYTLNNLEIKLKEKVYGEYTRTDLLKLALKNYNEALEFEANDATIYFDMAQIYWLQNEYESMEKLNKKAYELNRYNPFYKLLYKDVLDMLGKEVQKERLRDSLNNGTWSKFWKDKAPDDFYVVASAWVSECFVKVKKHKIDPHTHYSK